jgi:hypothetical protein
MKKMQKTAISPSKARNTAIHSKISISQKPIFFFLRVPAMWCWPYRPKVIRAEGLLWVGAK